MCLEHVDLVRKGLSKTVFAGYKVFRIPRLYRSNDLYFQWYHYANTKKVPFDKWLIAEQESIWGNNKVYTTGFHVYKYRQDAIDTVWLESEKMVKVKCKGILAEGKGIKGRKVIVVSHMSVPRQRKSRTVKSV